MTTQTHTSIDAGAIIGILQAHYPAPEWATFAELRCGTGYSNDQRLDLFALNLWPSKAFRSLAFEVKVSRADFMREIQDPRKRAFAERVAGECYFCTPVGLVQKDEVPDGWGLAEVAGGALRTAKLARQHRPEPWPMSFIAAIARRTSDPTPRLKKTAWRSAGHDLDEETLLAIAYESLERTRERDIADAQRTARHAYEESADGRALVELQAAVCRVTGDYRPTAERFTAWAAEHAGAAMGPALRAALRTLRGCIDDALKEVQP